MRVYSIYCYSNKQEQNADKGLYNVFNAREFLNYKMFMRKATTYGIVSLLYHLKSDIHCFCIDWPTNTK